MPLRIALQTDSFWKPHPRIDEDNPQVPEESLVTRKTHYQVHRAVDGRSEVITATETTAGDVNEAHRMVSVLESHQPTRAEQPRPW